MHVNILVLNYAKQGEVLVSAMIRTIFNYIFNSSRVCMGRKNVIFTRIIIEINTRFLMAEHLDYLFLFGDSDIKTKRV